jgi:hypothetical protein
MVRNDMQVSSGERDRTASTLRVTTSASAGGAGDARVLIGFVGHEIINQGTPPRSDGTRATKALLDSS